MRDTASVVELGRPAGRYLRTARRHSVSFRTIMQEVAKHAYRNLLCPFVVP